MTIEPVSEVPVYRQLAGIIRDRIKSGELPPGSLVPSESTLQQEHGVARDTVRRAMQVLREEGLIVTTPGKGTFVRKNRPADG